MTKNRATREALEALYPEFEIVMRPRRSLFWTLWSPSNLLLINFTRPTRCIEGTTWTSNFVCTAVAGFYFSVGPMWRRSRYGLRNVEISMSVGHCCSLRRSAVGCYQCRGIPPSGTNLWISWIVRLVLRSLAPGDYEILCIGRHEFHFRRQSWCHQL